MFLFARIIQGVTPPLAALAGVPMAVIPVGPGTTADLAPTLVASTTHVLVSSDGRAYYRLDGTSATVGGSPILGSWEIFSRAAAAQARLRADSSGFIYVTQLTR